MPGPASQSIAALVAHHVQLDSAPMGPRQYGIWLLASGGTLLDGLSIFLLGVAMPLITSRFALGPLMVEKGRNRDRHRFSGQRVLRV